MRLKALVFDMDGTLADSDPLHLVAFSNMMTPLGIGVDEEIYRNRIAGRTNASIFADFFPDAPVQEQERLADEKEAAFRQLASDLAPLPGLLRLLDWATDAGLGIGLVTNAPPENARHILEVLGIHSRFEVRIVGGDVARGKPDPLPYLTALERLGVPAAEAVAFEDSVSGVKAAKAAGLLTFGVLTGQTETTLRAAGADQVIRDFDAQVLWKLLADRSPSRS
jgi:HAD superfamily hydrolase (TIGR01509 family)